MSLVPRLLYIGDVPVELSYHGSALLYRLLAAYPASKLEIIEAGTSISKPERRLPNVQYTDARMPLAGLQTTWLASVYTAINLRMAVLRAARLSATAATFRPEALLTVAHGYSWMAAAEVAKRLSVPLHLVCHDEWARTGIASRWKDRMFGRHYRAAASRLCVSPFMAREYETRYGAKGTVLYPSRAQNALSFPMWSNRVRTESRPFTCAFAGTINLSGVVDALKALASSLETLGGHLLIFGPLEASQARSAGLELPNIELGGLLSSEELMEVLRERADCLFVPMSFALEDRIGVQLSFPSKLTDYTALRMPILLYGPPYCSAAVWGRENPCSLLAVQTEDRTVLSSALARLAGDANLRISLSKAAGLVGDRDFSHASAMAIFMSALKVGQADYRVSD